MSIHFVRDEKELEKRVSDPTMTSSMICSDQLVTTFHRKKKVYMNSNYAIGFTVLELSKLIIQKRYYEDIQRVFPGEAAVLMSDTDSLVLLLKERSVEGALYKMMDFLDTSNLPPEHPLYDAKKKNVLGYMKSECSNDPIINFCAVRSKSYCIQTLNGDMTRRAKGVPTTFRNRLSFDDYENVINNVDVFTLNTYGLLAKNHIVRMVKQKRNAFSTLDDKRYYTCSKHSIPHGSILKGDHEHNDEDCYFCKDYQNLFDQREPDPFTIMFENTFDEEENYENTSSAESVSSIDSKLCVSNSDDSENK